ncbi:MAG: MlaD family protein [Helicobacteraceae bacterium]|jgi:phospholipid/cholesterol/gamma-HCH transport system substrate-binding protein|nr:MlaD family protein [Helicobacteraceae bacterium]
MRAESKVGLFVLIGVVALILLSTRVSSVANLGREGYRLIAEVSSAAGLELNSPVRVQGVEAGYLENIDLERGKVVLTLFIYEGRQISADSVMIIAQESMLGGNAINIVYGASDRLLQDGDRIEKYRRYASIDEAVDEVKNFMEGLNEAFDAETRNNLKEAIASLRTMGDKLGAAGEEFRIAGKTVNESLPKIMAQIDDLSAEFKQTGKDINAKLPEILEKFSKLEDNLLNLVGESEDNASSLDSTIASVKVFFDKGTDTLEGLDAMLGKIDKAELQIDLGHARMFNDGFGESELSVAYLPNPTNYYMLGVSAAPIIDRLNSSGKAILPKLHDDDGEYLVSAQLGKRYKNWLLRGGLIRDTGGVGVDYFSDDDRLKLSLEAYDFNAVNDIRGSSAHLRFTARYLPWKFIALYGGYDNFLNRDADNFFAGAGVHFVDDDLKYLLLSGGSSAAGLAK